TEGMVFSVAISADGEYIATGSREDEYLARNGKVYLFDKDSSTPLWNYTTGGTVQSVAISADGEYIVASNDDGWVYLFDKNISQNGGGGDGGGSWNFEEVVCQYGDTKLADDGCNQCICNNNEWACTEVACNPDDSDGGIPAPSLAAAVAAVAVIALRRRR
ncbi:MAG: PQQ-binding-like beta-propeller repeat protein, partial [Candidatus Poseidoniia archaeon]|nr:PQQ-binding-like beta-propeller repeat protein [Candidatus Poseidoniia archaeon]